MLEILTVIYALIFGLCFGSFANVIIFRLPRGESIVAPPSHCTACGSRLKTRDLIPVLSWLILRGRCRYCGEKVSWRYAAVESACAVLFAVTAARTGASLAVIPLCVLAFVLLCVSCIDIDTQEIPDGLLIFGGSVGILWVAVSAAVPLGAPVWYDAMFGMVAGAAPLFIIDRICLLLLKKDGFGYGDVKMMAAAGIFLGWRMTLISLFCAVVAGGAWGAAMLITGRARRDSYMAFGPFLAAGVMIAMWFGQNIAEKIFIL